MSPEVRHRIEGLRFPSRAFGPDERRETTEVSAPPLPGPQAACAPAGSCPRHKESRAPRGSSAVRPKDAPANRPFAPTLRQMSSSLQPAHSLRRRDAADRPPQFPRSQTAGKASPGTAYPPAGSACASASAPAARSAPAHPKQPRQSASSRRRDQGNAVRGRFAVKNSLAKRVSR